MQGEIKLLKAVFRNESIGDETEVTGEIRELINSALATLPLIRERRVLQLRFGLVDGRCWTLKEVGMLFGVTGERIRQIEAKALRKMRHPSRTKHLRYFIFGY